MRRMRIYLAAPLFTLAERRFNEDLARRLESKVDFLEVNLHQIFQDETGTGEGHTGRMFQRCMDAIDAADAVVAILDGPDADSGTCVQIGYAKAKGKPIIGIRTDFRGCQAPGLDLRVSNVCSRLVLKTGADATVEDLASEVAGLLKGEFTPRQ